MSNIDLTDDIRAEIALSGSLGQSMGQTAGALYVKKRRDKQQRALVSILNQGAGEGWDTEKIRQKVIQDADAIKTQVGQEVATYMLTQQEYDKARMGYYNRYGGERGQLVQQYRALSQAWSDVVQSYNTTKINDPQSPMLPNMESQIRLLQDQMDNVLQRIQGGAIPEASSVEIPPGRGTPPTFMPEEQRLYEQSRSGGVGLQANATPSAKGPSFWQKAGNVASDFMNRPTLQSPGIQPARTQEDRLANELKQDAGEVDAITGVRPITATNKQTGEKMISFDGGRTWQMLQ